MAASSLCITKSPSDFAPDRLGKHRKVILQVSASLILIGVKPECFIEDTHLRHGFFSKAFASRLRVFHGISDELKLERILHIGVKNSTFDTIRGMVPGEFYDFLMFLRTKEGQQALQDLRTLEKLQKRQGNGLTAEKSSLLALADEKTEEIDQHIKHLRRKLASMRQDREEKLGQLKLRFASTMTSPEIDLRALFLESWNVLQAKMDYVVKLLETQERTIEAFQAKNDDNPLLTENLSPTDVRYESLYFESLKKVQALMDENHKLTQKLETALSKAEARDKGNVDFSEVVEKMEDVILVSNLTKLTETAVTAHSQAIRDTIAMSLGMGREARPSAAKRMKMTRQSEKS